MNSIFSKINDKGVSIFVLDSQSVSRGCLAHDVHLLNVRFCIDDVSYFQAFHNGLSLSNPIKR